MKTLTLIRGLPGSGKSTMASDLIDNYTKHFEADMFFMNGDTYRFDASKIKEAHEWCQSNTRQALLDGYSVVVSNTFIKRWELDPYVNIANDSSIHCSLRILVAKGEYQNSHNVPEDVILRMKNNWEK